jgi:hypothetical protein
MNKVKFRWGEETYTLCVTQDDCWLEDGPSDISDRMLKGMDELAMENGMLPPKGLCAGCWKGTYEDIVEDYHIRNTKPERKPNQMNKILIAYIVGLIVGAGVTLCIVEQLLK